jgi:outer membrane biogenesis lipoprotein LolB
MKTPKKLQITITSIAAAILCGCASTESTQPMRWTHPEGRTQDQIERDLAECRIMAHQPGAFQGGNAAWYMATRSGNRNDSLARDCMLAKGYKLIPAK